MYAAIPAGPIDCLSLLQPWGMLLTLWRDGKAIGKAIETRSKPTRHRGLLAIHASKGDRDLKAFLYACERQDKSPLVTHALAALEEFYPGRNIEDLFPLGKVLAIGNLIRVEHTEMIRDRLSPRELAFGNYDDNRYGWMFSDMRQLETPVPALGSLGIWKWDPHYVPAPRVAKPKPVKEPKPAKEAKVSVVPVTHSVQQLSLFDQEQPMPIHAEDFDFDGPGSGINLALMTLPDDSDLATASAAERKKAFEPKKEQPETRKHVVIGSSSPVKFGAVQRAFEEILSDTPAYFMGVNVPSGVRNQPMSHTETRKGAENRAKAALALTLATDVTTCDFSVGIEGGVADTPDGMLSFAWVCVWDGKQPSFAQAMGYYLPQEVADLIRAGKELGEADDIVFGQTESKMAHGSVGLLTDNVITRFDYYMQAVMMALIPFKNKELTWTAPVYRESLKSSTPETPSTRDPLLEIAQSLAAEEQRKAIADFLSAYAEQTSCRQMVSQAVLVARQLTEAETNRLGDARLFLAKTSETLADMIAKGEVVLQGEDPARANDAVILYLRTTLAAREVDVKMLRGMLNVKNDQVVQLTNDLRKAREEATKYRDMLSEMMLDRNRAQLAAVNAMLDKEELEAQATTKIDGRIKSQKLVDPTDAQIEDYRNDPKWDRVFESYSDGKHFLRFECVEPYPQPEAEEDAQAAAEAAVPDEKPDLMPERMHHALFSPPVPVSQNSRSIADRLREPGGAEALKQEGNQAASAIGAAAASQRYAELQGNDDEPLVPEAAGMLIAGN